MRRLFIRGDGPTSCIFLANFLSQQHLAEKFNIVLPEDWQFSGGPGYKNVNDTLLMNSRPSGDSVYLSDKDDCMRFMGNNEYPTRKKYKQYLNTRCQEAVKELLDHSILLYDRPREGDLFLETPGFQKRYAEPLVKDAVADFYQDLDQLRNAKGNILVLGMGLCAVDAVTEIIRGDNDNKIHCYSRSGIWPRSHSTNLSAPKGGELFRLQINSALALSRILNKICEMNQCDTFWPKDTKKYYEVLPPTQGHNATGIAAAFRQSMLEIWNTWSDQEKQTWNNKYDLLYKKSRTGMSVPNAEIMYQAYINGRISSVYEVDTNRYDLIIDATGYCAKNPQRKSNDTVIISAPTDNPFVYPSISQSRLEVGACFQHLGCL